MKKRTILGIVLIVLCLGIFAGYCVWDNVRTDSTAPEIHLDGQLSEISLSESRETFLQGITATDDRDGDVTDSLLLEEIRMSDPQTRTARISVAAFDRAGNVARAQYEVVCTDYRSPRFSLSGPLVFPNNTTMNVLKYISAEDQLDGDLTSNIRANALQETTLGAAGVHEIEFRVTNSLGDTARLVLPVEVYAAGTYDADLTLTRYLVYLQQGDSFNIKDYLKDFILYSEEFSLENGLPANFELETVGDVDTDTPGVYPVACTVTFTRGVTSVRTHSAYSKLIVVVEG